MQDLELSAQRLQSHGLGKESRCGNRETKIHSFEERWEV